jgi:hypothetical protein
MTPKIWKEVVKDLPASATAATTTTKKDDGLYQIPVLGPFPDTLHS